MSPSPTHPLASRALARLQDESGIALVMALGMMLVLAIVLTTTIYFTSASVRHANASNGGQKAYALAEAGVNNAVAQIAPHYPNSTIAGDSSWVGIPAVPYGTNWSGSFDPLTNVWSLTGRGTVKNPTGGADITRTVTAKVRVLLQPPPFTKYGFFVDDAVGSCPDLSGNNTITVPIYTKGCLSLGGNLAIEEPAISGLTPATTTVSVNVGGSLSVNSGSAHVGTSAKRINWLGAGGGCNGAACQDNVGPFHAHTIGTYVPVSLPAVDMDAQYAKAKWSTASCTPGSTNPFDNDTTRNTSLSSTTLTGASYDCTARDGANNYIGRLAWNNSSSAVNGVPAKTLLVDGAVFVDRSLSWNSNDGLQYTGDGTIYANGTVSIKGTICGPGSSWTGGNCGKTWDPNAGRGKLLIVVGNAGHSNPALDFGSQAVVEAGLWVAWGNVDASGGSYLGGSVYVDNGTGSFRGGGGMQAFINLPSGAPTSQQYNIGPASAFTGG